jgi:glycosyltransferase involved in cell wall biosynthesis
MNRLPRISIVVPSFNQGAFIRETLQSLVDQQYPNLEVIIRDAGSTDGAIEIAREFVDRYPDVFHLTVEKDRGAAHAVNLALAQSSGEILGYLNTDDTLYPGCLHSVAREIDPARNRFVVFGRCLFTGEGAPFVGLEHPAEYRGHFDMLAVWRRGHNIIPQPSTFWHRTVSETCEPFDERYRYVLDYLQWCRFSKRFDFHKVDELWSTYRMHAASVSSNKTEDEWLDIMTGCSRMNWGPWWRLLRWRCELSSRWHDRRRQERARQHGREAARARAEGRYSAMIVSGVRSAVISPRVVWHQLAAPVMTRAAARLGLARNGDGGSLGRYPDGWIGPVYRAELDVPADARRLTVVLQHAPPDRAHATISSRLVLNGVVADRRQVKDACQFSLIADLTSARGRQCDLQVLTSGYFVPRLVDGVADDRKLSVVLLEQRID